MNWVLEKPFRPVLERSPFLSAEEALDPLPEPVSESTGEKPQRLDLRGRHRPVAKSPQDRAQLVFGMKGEAMVDTKKPLSVRDEMAQLPVGVVGDEIEYCERPESPRSSLHFSDGIKLRIDINVTLNRSGPIWAFTQHSFGDNALSHCLSHLVGQDLSGGESLDGEVPERTLSSGRLVDHLLPRDGRSQQRGVGGIDKAADDLGNLWIPILAQGR